MLNETQSSSAGATDPNHDAAALAASESKTQPTGGNLGKKHRKLIIFLIVVLVILIPLGGFMILRYTNKTASTPAPYSVK